MSLKTVPSRSFPRATWKTVPEFGSRLAVTSLTSISSFDCCPLVSCTFFSTLFTLSKKLEGAHPTEELSVRTSHHPRSDCRFRTSTSTFRCKLTSPRSSFLYDPIARNLLRFNALGTFSAQSSLLFSSPSSPVVFPISLSSLVSLFDWRDLSPLLALHVAWVSSSGADAKGKLLYSFALVSPETVGRSWISFSTTVNASFMADPWIPLSLLLILSPEVSPPSFTALKPETPCSCRGRPLPVSFFLDSWRNSGFTFDDFVGYLASACFVISTGIFLFCGDWTYIFLFLGLTT